MSPLILQSVAVSCRVGLATFCLPSLTCLAPSESGCLSAPHPPPQRLPGPVLLPYEPPQPIAGKGVAYKLSSKTLPAFEQQHQCLHHCSPVISDAGAGQGLKSQNARIL